MKIFDKYILKSFLKPFFATFFIILFVLVMQILWHAFDKLAGKGIGFVFILKFLWYTTLLVTPQAIPIGVLLSSIMTLGNLSENYEFAAAKSAGISLQRMIRPLIILVCALSVVNFVFYNNIYPYAALKQINLTVNAKKKQPELALVPGSFNTEIPDYHIKFDEKYGEKKNLLKNVIIYDLSSHSGNNKIITAEKGILDSKKGSRYLKFILKNGNFFEYHVNNSTSFEKRKRMPASFASFKEYTINIDVSSFSDDDMDQLKYTRSYRMLSLEQLKDTMPDLKKGFDNYINSRSRNLFVNVNGAELSVDTNTISNKKLNSDYIQNFDTPTKMEILNNAIRKVERSIDNFRINKNSFKRKRKIVNLYNIEYYNRITFSLSCLLLFFIGAPLGSIIRKGGMGLPMISAILIYAIYHFSNTLGKNMAEESSITALAGSCIALLLMAPLAVMLTRRATQDKGIFNIGNLLQPIIRFIKKNKKQFKLYQYDIDVSNSYEDEKSKYADITDDKLFDIAKNYYQYGYTKKERQIVINILKERNYDINTLISSGKIENEKLLQIFEKVESFKIIDKIILFTWLLSMLCYVVVGFSSFKVLIVIIFAAIQIISIVILDKQYKQLNVLFDNKLKHNFLFIYIGGILFYFVVSRAILSDIKNNLKQIT